MAVSFIGGGILSAWRKPPTCHTSHWQTFITWCCIKYTLPWTGFKLTTLVEIGTDCTVSCKSNSDAIKTTTPPKWSVSLLSCIHDLKLWSHLDIIWLSDFLLPISYVDFWMCNVRSLIIEDYFFRYFINNPILLFQLVIGICPVFRTDEPHPWCNGYHARLDRVKSKTLKLIFVVSPLKYTALRWKRKEWLAWKIGKSHWKFPFLAMIKLNWR